MNLKLGRAVLVVASALSGLVACGTSEAPAGDDAEQDLSAAAAGLGPEAARLWDAYVSEVKAGPPLQSGCAPLRVPATVAAGKAPLGVVVLFHGYTACPQQFMNFDRTVGGHTETVGLASRLSKAGYEVLLPLLPGHGRVPQTNPKWPAGSTSTEPLAETEANRFPVIDDSSDVPAPLSGVDQLEGSPYTKLVRKMNAIMATVTPPNRVVGGISVGAVLATQATIEASKDKPYTRALIAAPFYQAGDAQLNLAREAAIVAERGANLATTDSLRDLIALPLSEWKLDPRIFTKLVQSAVWKKLGESPLGWGQVCEMQERKFGRAGICQFKMKHLAGVLLYGSLVEKKVATLHDGATLFQVTGVVDDPVVNNLEVKNVVASLTAATAGRTSFCVFEKANHSMFSWHDVASANEDKAWIPPLENRTVAFLTQSGASAPFTTTGTTAKDKLAGQLPVCSVK